MINEKIVQRVGGCLANHPKTRLLASQIMELTGLKYWQVVKALFELRNRRLIGRRRKLRGIEVFTYKICQRRVKQSSLWPELPGTRTKK
jgi:transcription initiation factor IIE alpha subunit